LTNVKLMRHPRAEEAGRIIPSAAGKFAGGVISKRSLPDFASYERSRSLQKFASVAIACPERGLTGRRAGQSP